MTSVLGSIGRVYESQVIKLVHWTESGRIDEYRRSWRVINDLTLLLEECTPRERDVVEEEQDEKEARRRR